MAALLDDLYALDDHEDQTANQMLQQYLPHVQDFVWTGRPVQGFLFTKAAIGNFFLGTAFLLGGALAVLLLVATDMPWWALLFGVTFGGTGLYLSVGSFFGDRHARRQTAYGLTTKGLHVVHRKAVVFYDIHTVAEADVQGRCYNGAGQLALHERRGTYTHVENYTAYIPNAEAVLQLVRQLSAEAPPK